MFYKNYKQQTLGVMLSGLIANLVVNYGDEVYAEPMVESGSFSLSIHEIRKSDAYGFGYYGSSRGNRSHAGTDYVIRPGEAVLSPVDGTIQRLGIAYADDSFELVVIDTKSGDSIKILYVQPIVEPGQDVKCGQLIGYAQDITARYPGITAHVHVEIVTATRGRIDPTTYTAGCSA